MSEACYAFNDGNRDPWVRFNASLSRLREALGETVSYQWSTATHPYPRERTWSDCEAEIERLQERIRIQEELLDYANKAEIERLRAALVADDEGSTAYQSGWHARDAEIERLRLENSQWQSACAGYTEALAARDRDNAALLEKLARIRDQIAKHNISIKEAIRRGEAFEWKTLTLDS